VFVEHLGGFGFGSTVAVYPVGNHHVDRGLLKSVLKFLGERDEFHAAVNVVCYPCWVPDILHQSAVLSLVSHGLFLHDGLQVSGYLVPCLS